MTLWIIDTDHISLFLAGNKSVIAQVAEHSDNVAITIITVQELFNGWNGKLNDPRQANKLFIQSVSLKKSIIVADVLDIRSSPSASPNQPKRLLNKGLIINGKSIKFQWLAEFNKCLCTLSWRVNRSIRVLSFAIRKSKIFGALSPLDAYLCRLDKISKNSFSIPETSI